MKKRLGALCALILSVTNAGAISRVGNARIGDPGLGFSAAVPDDFPDVYDLERNSLRLLSSRLAFNRETLGGFRNLQIQLRPLVVAFPPYSTWDKAQLPAGLVHAAGGLWREQPLRDPCLLALRRPADPAAPHGLHQFLVAWGVGKGVLLLGDNEAEVWSAMLEIVNSLTLENGACAW